MVAKSGFHIEWKKINQSQSRKILVDKTKHVHRHKQYI